MAHAIPDVEIQLRPARNALRPLTLKQVLVVSGNVDRPLATVTVVVNGRHETRQHNGKGPVDALFQAINDSVGEYARDVELTAYSVRSRGKGTDAVAYVKVCAQKGGKSYLGSHEHIDTLVASAHAYIDALRKIDI